MCKNFCKNICKKMCKMCKNCVNIFFLLCKIFAKFLHFSNLHSDFRPREESVTFVFWNIVCIPFMPVKSIKFKTVTFCICIILQIKYAKGNSVYVWNDLHDFYPFFLQNLIPIYRDEKSRFAIHGSNEVSFRENYIVCSIRSG